MGFSLFIEGRLQGLLQELPNVPLFSALWFLFDGTWGLLKGSWGVLVYRGI